MALVKVRFKDSGLRCLGPRRDVVVEAGKVYEVEENQLPRFKADAFERLPQNTPTQDPAEAILAMLETGAIDQASADSMIAAIRAEQAELAAAQAEQEATDSFEAADEDEDDEADDADQEAADEAAPAPKRGRGRRG